ncbi:hypothetical protein BO82DRAFT_394173 [Aspergillus uvarum CBS 121591]|uniref:Uncharacterized protein n=1 Tax=Aspergillus uvarum CBS 121591 TaxID=1448315 RepID=A0A319C1Q5_9EURO|nr:hypothetical protein BO82DRAFT_394173 [Aspergillus uvarum CBS 121591]PYH79014.1 hypothetical protein BO82DRAFT_394173 [Aspergillus uvarum CBS 121591]
MAPLTFAPSEFQLEIKSEFKVQGGCKEFEAAFARRSMMLMRRLLGDERLTELLQDEITASDAYWKKTCAESNGKWRASRIQVSPRGISIKDFHSWFMQEATPDAEKVASHPEHWVINTLQGSTDMSVLETLGDKVTLFKMTTVDDVPDFIDQVAEYPIKMKFRGFTEGKVHMAEVYHQFKENADGQSFDADLAVYFPAACGDDLIETHRQHLLVEFNNWFQQAYLAKQSS